ncbi:MAG TPA: arginine deiminase-related protein [Nitrospiria bacterium]|nr:arginine deiminase-related protein [Nitrospiria bacterium]
MNRFFQAEKSRLLMCRPDFFRIAYEINPWMNKKNQTDHDKAQKQWEALYATLTGPFGLKVDLIPPQPDLPDMVFTANGGLVHGKKVYLSNFRHPERQGERKYFQEWFSENGYDVISLSDDISFEGEGDALWLEDHLVAGYPFRTDVSSHLFLARELQCKVISLELTDPRFYHLDTCFAPLRARTALYAPEAFTSDSLKRLAPFVDELIPLTPEEAAQFSANAVVSGRKIVLQAGSDSARKKLEHAGFEVYPHDLSEFIKSGGNAKCLVLWI